MFFLTFSDGLAVCKALTDTSLPKGSVERPPEEGSGWEAPP